MKSITAFELVLLPFPFTDLSTHKKRPALVLHRYDWPRLPNHFLVAMVTSQLDGLKLPEDVKVAHWKEAGLPKPSLVRLGKLVTLEGSLIIRKLGILNKEDQSAMRRMFKRHYGSLCRE